MSEHILIITGHLGRDPEMRFTQSGQAVTSLNVATSRKFTNAAGEKTEVTTWFRVSVWGKQAETCNQYLKKGSLIQVQGRLEPDPATGSPRIWTKQDGAAGASFEVTATNVAFLSGGSGGNGGAPAAEEEGQEIPF